MASHASPPSYPDSPPRRRYAPRLSPEQRRAQLQDAALTVILDRGYSGVSIEAVARIAGVTRPVVYDHFPNLGQLLHALVEREERNALQELEDVVPVARNRARMDERIVRLVRWGVERSGFPDDLDVELTAKAIRALGEEAGRMVLTDQNRYPPERYERFVESVMRLVWPLDGPDH